MSAMFRPVYSRKRGWPVNGVTYLISLVLAVSTPGPSGDAKAIVDADSACSAASEAQGLEGFLSCFAEEATSLPPAGAPIQGKSALRESLRASFTSEGHSLTWQPIRAEASRSGDLGFSFGTYELKTRDKDGKPLSVTGKYTSIWKKQDGHWKIVVDMGN
jgi:ketosteroid isomerase-like protein